LRHALMRRVVAIEFLAVHGALMSSQPPNRPQKLDRQQTQRFHRALVLNLVRADHRLTRAEIARQTKLSPAAVSGIVDALVRIGLLREGSATATGGLGRRPVQLLFNPGARLALGIAIDVPQISAALVDLGGDLREVFRVPLAPKAQPDEVLALAASLGQRALRSAGGTPVIGVGVAAPGIVSWPNGVNRFSPNFGWHGVPIREQLETLLVQRVLVDNEVRALALAEYHFGAARGARTAVFIDAGYGLGGAVILDGNLYRGVHNAAGEVGHNTVDPEGPLCACGNRGCLEVYASVNGLVARAREALAAGRVSALTDPDHAVLISIEAIAKAAESGDSVATDLLGRAARYLGLAVANAVDNWDPELVVLSGPVIDCGGQFFDDLLVAEQRSVLESARNRVEVRRAVIHPDAKVVGAATLVIAEYLAAPEAYTTRVH
jgi:predicted NBD/HSP70 family sugar kinase